MELVHGEPITEYCDKNRLTIKERLDLFIQVCEGVQHAHQKGIIHRDIKPSNILITIQADKPVPKIIDFGVAKATSQKLTERTVYTELGQLIGTPEYMSPEQAEMTGIDIDTRTDVYSLGVVLYELLVGAQPFDAKTLRQTSFDDMRRKIREEEPVKPSTRLPRMGDPSTTAAKNRRLELRSLERELRGDLDWITMNALEKDRTRRYSSPSDLAADIQRHLSHEPVMAGPPSTAYRMRKFIRRHRIGVAAATALFATPIGFAVMMTIQSARIARERDRTAQEAAKAQAINAFLQETLGSADPYEGQGRDITIAEALDAAVKRIDESFENQREIEAAIKNTIGYTYCGLGRYDKAEPLLVSALAARREMFGNEHLDVAESALNLGHLRRSQETYDVSENLFREALAIRRRLLGDEHLAVAEALDAIGGLFWQLGETGAAGSYYHEALEIRRRLLGDEHPEMAGSLNNLSLLYRDTGDYESSEKYMREALAIERELFGDEHPEVAGTLVNLATVLNAKGAYEAAEAPARESRALHLKLLGETHWLTGATLRVLADTLSGLGEYQESEQLYRQAIPILRESLGPDHFRTAICRRNLGAVLTKVGRYEEAEKEVLFGFRVFQGYGEAHQRTQGTVRYLIELYEAWGKPQKAAEYRAMLTKEESE
jgi:non-specific serine/threonine protein kinase/serine/threonine-protein kinase